MSSKPKAAKVKSKPTKESSDSTDIKTTETTEIYVVPTCYLTMYGLMPAKPYTNNEIENDYLSKKTQCKKLVYKREFCDCNIKREFESETGFSVIRILHLINETETYHLKTCDIYSNKTADEIDSDVLEEIRGVMDGFEIKIKNGVGNLMLYIST